MNPSMSSQLARERTRDLLASRAQRTPLLPHPSHERSHGLIGRLLVATRGR